jgi:hypothetical protein
MMSIEDTINANLPHGSRPIQSIAAPGDLSPRVISILAEKIPADQIRQTIQEMMSAERPLKGGASIPDWRAREAAVKLWLAYCEGLPIQRQQIVTHQVSGPDLWETAKTNPHVREALRNQLAALDAADKSVEI